MVMPDDSCGQQFIPHRKVKAILGISDTTVHRWAKSGRLNFITTSTGRKLYDIYSIRSQDQKKNCQKICYCRVSTQKQAPDLANQIKYCQSNYPDHEIISDIESALNRRRKGMLTLLDRVIEGNIQEVVVTHKDRLCRFGFELISHLFEKYQVKLVVLDQASKSEIEDFTDDVISIITVFSARYYGHRKYHDQ